MFPAQDPLFILESDFSAFECILGETVNQSTRGQVCEPIGLFLLGALQQSETRIRFIKWLELSQPNGGTQRRPARVFAM